MNHEPWMIETENVFIAKKTKKKLLRSIRLHVDFRYFLFFRFSLETFPAHDRNYLFSPFTLQHSLVSEIRDIVYPEDRLRFDELMFRHGVTVNVLSNNVATLYGRRSGVCCRYLTTFASMIS